MKPGWSRRFRNRAEYRLDQFLGSYPALQLLLLSALGFLLALAFGVIASLLLGGEPDVDSVPKGFWWALTRMLDGGTVWNDSGVVRRGLGVAVTAIGLVLVTVLTGAFASSFSERVAAVRRGQSYVFERGHLLLLGWNSRAGVVIRELGKSGERYTLVVLATRSRESLEAEIRERLDGVRHRLRIIVRTGDPTTTAAVRRISAARAKVALILPEAAFEQAEPADRWAMRAILALRRATHKKPIPTIVEVPDLAGEELVALAVEPGTPLSVVRAREVVASLLVQTVRQKGVFEVIRKILSLTSTSIVIHPPGALAGKTFDAAHASIDNGVLLGLLQDERPWFCPPGSSPIGAGDQLIVLSNERRAPTLRGTLPSGAADAPGCAVDAPAEDVLVVGYKPELVDMLSLLERATEQGTMRATLLVPEGRAAAVRQAVDAARLARVQVDVVPGVGSDPETLRRVLDRPRDVALLLAEDVPSEQIEDADAEQVVALLIARKLRDEAGHGMRLIAEVRNPNTKRLVLWGDEAGDFVVSREIVGMLLAQQMVACHRQAHGGEWSTAVHREIFDGRGVEVQVRGMATYARADERLTFADLMARARSRGEIAVGFHDGEDRLYLSPGRAQRLATGPRAWAAVLAGEPAERNPAAGAEKRAAPAT